MSSFHTASASSPRSPTSSMPIANGAGSLPSVASSTQKARRSVRLISQLPDDDDSSSEDERSRITDPPTDSLQPHTRHTSFPSLGAQRLTTGAFASASPSQSKLSRVNQSIPSTLRHTSSLLASAPTPSAELGPGSKAWRTPQRSAAAENLSEAESDEDDPPFLPSTPIDNPLADPKEAKIRLEWRSMLGSVLSGDVLRGESSRIGVDKPGDVVFRKRLGDSFWWQIRARMRGRSEEEELKNCNDRRQKVVDAVLEEVDAFHVTGDALEQVTAILDKLNVVEALYPHQAALRAAKPLYDSPGLQNKISAMTAWSTIFTSLRNQVAVLQKWTGSDDLDITQKNTTREKALVAKNTYHPLDAKRLANDQADDSTFLDRVLKEDNVQRTFEKRVFADLLSLLHNAKDTVITYQPVFDELKLPDFRHETVRLISFPGRLIMETLKTTLETAAKALDPLAIAGMVENLRLIISVAVLIKRQHEEVVAPDPDKRWNAPHCLPPDYDATLINGIRLFFKLLHTKLKDGEKATYFRETEILEDEWDFLGEAAEAVEGGDLVVAEQFCALTNKLLLRIIKSFHQQLQSAPADDASYYVKMFDIVRMRYRKLQRFARRLAQKFDNSAEYIFYDQDLENLIERLRLSGHFLIYTSLYEDTGTYILASAGLWNDATSIRRLLQRAFFTTPPIRQQLSDASGDGHESDEDGVPYLVLLSPRSSFAWTGGVMTLDLNYIDLGLPDNRLRIISEGPGPQLALAKDMLTQCLEEEEDLPPLQLTCSIPQQPHLPRLQRESLRIGRSAYRLSESFIQSASYVATSLARIPGSQDLVENWYLFASDHGRRVASTVEYSLLERFSRLLMRLAISWIRFIAETCDREDRRTFRWTIQALDYASSVTSESNILYLDNDEFSHLRKTVSSLIKVLISHFDILGAKSAAEQKKEQDRLANNRRQQRLEENADAITTSGESSIRLVRQERLRLIAELEQQRIGLSNDQHMTGQVLDESVSEDRSLVFLAASSSNIALRWQQGAFIGGGANGNVFRGTNLDSGGIMAVKEIRVQDINASKELYKQIKDESDVMSMLSHENIVEYYGIEVHRDRVYIFEEYCQGGSLANLLEHGRIEDEDVVRVYASEILSGLEYLHSKGIEHRDIKPDNILLSATSHVKLVDFGAAKVIAKNKTLARTRAARTNKADPQDVVNSLAGTPMYMAPEVIRNDSARRMGSADIWSLGCVILEIVTGYVNRIAIADDRRKPWSNLDNEWAIMFHIGIATQHPPLPDTDQLSDLGIDFIAQCLTLDPGERPTASDLLQHPWIAMLSEDAWQESENAEEWQDGYDETAEVLDENEE